MSERKERLKERGIGSDGSGDGSKRGDLDSKLKPYL